MYTFNIGCVIEDYRYNCEKTSKAFAFREITMPRLKRNQRPIAVGMIEAGLRHVDVAEHLSVSHGTVTCLVALSVRLFGRSRDLE